MSISGSGRGAGGTPGNGLSRCRIRSLLQSIRRGLRTGLDVRGWGSVPARAAASSSVRVDAGRPKYVRAAASAPKSPGPHSTTLRYSSGHDELHGLPHQAPIRPEVEVLGQLLRNRAPPSQLVAVGPHVRDGPRQSPQVRRAQPREPVGPGPADLLGEGAPVDAPVLSKAVVLGHDHRTDEAPRDLGQGRPLLHDLQGVPLPEGFAHTLLHERGTPRIPDVQAPGIGHHDAPDQEHGDESRAGDREVDGSLPHQPPGLGNLPSQVRGAHRVPPQPPDPPRRPNSARKSAQVFGSRRTSEGSVGTGMTNRRESLPISTVSTSAGTLPPSE